MRVAEYRANCTKRLRAGDRGAQHRVTSRTMELQTRRVVRPDSRAFSCELCARYRHHAVRTPAVGVHGSHSMIAFTCERAVTAKRCRTEDHRLIDCIEPVRVQCQLSSQRRVDIRSLHRSSSARCDRHCLAGRPDDLCVEARKVTVADNGALCTSAAVQFGVTHCAFARARAHIITDAPNDALVLHRVDFGAAQRAIDCSRGTHHPPARS